MFEKGSFNNLRSSQSASLNYDIASMLETCIHSKRDRLRQHKFSGDVRIEIHYEHFAFFSGTKLVLT
jgi:hypothetical protein